VQFFEHGGAEGRGVDVDVRRDHLHRIQVEVAPTEQGQDFLGDADAVDEADVDAHGAVQCLECGGGKYALGRGLVKSDQNRSLRQLLQRIAIMWELPKAAIFDWGHSSVQD
jgi:hypothetical protein